MAKIVSAASIRGALSILRVAGLPTEPVLERLGLRPAHILDNEARFEAEVWAQLWKELERATGDDLVGLRAAVAMPRDNFDVLKYVCESCDRLGDAIDKTKRYIRVFAATVEITTTSRDDQTRIAVSVAGNPANPYPHHVIDFVLACTFLGLNDASSRSWSATRLQFRAERPPGSAEEYRRVYGCAPEFGDDTDGFWFDRSLIDLPMKAPNPSLHQLLTAHAEHLFARAPAFGDPLRGVRTILLEELRGGEPTLEHVAKRLGSSRRSLQRSLSANGTTFSRVLDELRRDLARRYLSTPLLRIEAIAVLLGYRDLSSFDRAFRRWTGTSPTGYRSRAGEGP